MTGRDVAVRKCGRVISLIIQHKLNVQWKHKDHLVLSRRSRTVISSVGRNKFHFCQKLTLHQQNRSQNPMFLLTESFRLTTGKKKSVYLGSMWLSYFNTVCFCASNIICRSIFKALNKIKLHPLTVLLQPYSLPYILTINIYIILIWKKKVWKELYLFMNCIIWGFSILIIIPVEFWYLG